MFERLPYAVFALCCVACTGDVSNPNGLLGGDDAVVDTPDDDEVEIVAAIIDDNPVVDDGVVSLTAAPVEDGSYAWDLGDGTTDTGPSVTHIYPGPGCYVITLTVTAPNARPDTVTGHAYVIDDAAFDVDPLPADHGFVARTPNTMVGPVEVTGTAVSPGWQAIEVDVIADGTVQHTFRTPLCSLEEEDFVVNVDIPVALTKYDLAVRAVAGEEVQELESATDLVAGDVIIVQGQSNAVSANYTSGLTLPTNDFVRSFGSASTTEATSIADNTWRTAQGNSANTTASIGQWASKMANDLVERHHVPLAVFNGAHGGQAIAFFQRNDANPGLTSTNYGRLLRRLRAAGLDDDVRIVFFFQGESDGSNAEGHRTLFTALYDDWREDYPTIEHLYVTQVRPGCGNPSVELRDIQRQFATTLANTTAMSSSAMDSHDGCHYKFVDGYETLGSQYARLLSRDMYGVTGERDLEAINVTSATYDAANSRITITTRSDATSLTAESGIASVFTVIGGSRTVSAVAVQDDTIVLTLGGTGTPTEVQYIGHQQVGPTILNARGVGLLVFRLPL